MAAVAARRPSLRGGAARLAWLGGAAAVGAGLAVVVPVLPPPLAGLALPGAALAAVAVVGAYTRPAAVAALAFALLAVVRTEPAPSDLLVLVLIGAALTGRRCGAPRLPVGAAAGLVAFVALSTASLANAEHAGAALRYHAITLYLIGFAVWITAAFADERLARRCARAYIWSAIASSVVAIAALKLPLPGRELFLYDASRAQALFKDPNVFGPYLVPAAAILLEELVRPRLLGWSTRRTMIAFAICAGGTVFAFSRAGWLNLAVATTTVVLVELMRRRGAGRALKAAAALAACGVAGLVFLAASGSLTFFQSRTQLQGYDTERFANQASGLAKATVHLLGFGPGEAERVLAFSAHSLPVRLLVEQGIPGLAAIVALLVATVAAAVAWTMRDGHLHGIGSAALLGSLLGLIVNSPFVDTLHWRHLWMVLGLVWVGAALPRTATGTTTVPPR